MQVAERELYAQDYLFKSATMVKRSGTLNAMWGIKMDTTKAPVAQSIVRRSPRVVAMGKNQSRMDTFMEDRLLVAEIKKEKSKRTKK